MYIDTRSERVKTYKEWYANAKHTRTGIEPDIEHFMKNEYFLRFFCFSKTNKEC